MDDTYSYDIPINIMTLLELYWYDKVWDESLPLFCDLSDKRKRYLLESHCFALFLNSERAKALQIEMLAKLN